MNHEPWCTAWSPCHDPSTNTPPDAPGQYLILKNRIAQLETILTELTNFLADVYWPEGQEPLLWSNRIDRAQTVLLGAKKPICCPLPVGHP